VVEGNGRAFTRKLSAIQIEARRHEKFAAAGDIDSVLLHWQHELATCCATAALIEA
jgi:hypothetical protein